MRKIDGENGENEPTRAQELRRQRQGRRLASSLPEQESASHGFPLATERKAGRPRFSSWIFLREADLEGRMGYSGLWPVLSVPPKPRCPSLSRPILHPAVR